MPRLRARCTCPQCRRSRFEPREAMRSTLRDASSTSWCASQKALAERRGRGNGLQSKLTRHASPRELGIQRCRQTDRLWRGSRRPFRLNLNFSLAKFRCCEARACEIRDCDGGCETCAFSFSKVTVAPTLPRCKSRLSSIGRTNGSVLSPFCATMSSPTTSMPHSATPPATAGSCCIVDYSIDDLVSTDIVGSPASYVFDSQLTMASGRLAKVLLCTTTNGVAPTGSPN